MMYLGIDIGGTTIKFGLVDDTGTIHFQSSIVTTKLDSKTAAAQAAQDMHELLPHDPQQPQAIGVAVPGSVDAYGALTMAPNIALDLNLLIQALEREFAPASTFVINDANAAALGELWVGAAASVQDYVFVTLGTGVGGGIVYNGEILIGYQGGAGEIGHITVEPKGHRCGCGRDGCLEMYASARGLVLLYLDEAKNTQDPPVKLEHPAHAKPIFDAARMGNKSAQRAIGHLSDYLAQALSQITCVVAPECFVIGGGMSAAYDLFAPSLVAYYKRYTLPAAKNTPIKQAQLGNDAGLLGAAYFALQASR